MATIDLDRFRLMRSLIFVIKQICFPSLHVSPASARATEGLRVETQPTGDRFRSIPMPWADSRYILQASLSWSGLGVDLSIHLINLLAESLNSWRSLQLEPVFQMYRVSSVNGLRRERQKKTAQENFAQEKRGGRGTYVGVNRPLSSVNGSTSRKQFRTRS